jgi:hypothetical protein
MIPNADEIIQKEVSTVTSTVRSWIIKIDDKPFNLPDYTHNTG